MYVLFFFLIYYLLFLFLKLTSIVKVLLFYLKRESSLMWSNQVGPTIFNIFTKVLLINVI